MALRLLLVSLLLACVATSQAAQIADAEGQGGARRLLDVAMAPDDIVNGTYPNATVYVSLDPSYQSGCTPWWERVQAGATQCPKACAVSFDPSTTAQLSPLNVKVEKGSVSRIMPRPIKGSYLSVNGTVPKANPDEFQRISSDTGLVLVQYTASGTTNTKFTAIMGLIKKDPTANGQAVPAKVGTQQGQAKHIPYCFFNVTWTIVPPGSIKGAAKAGGAPAPAPLLATAAKKPAATAPELATAAKKPAAPAPDAAAASDAETATPAAPKKAAAAAPAAADDLGGGGY